MTMENLNRQDARVAKQNLRLAALASGRLILLFVFVACSDDAKRETASLSAAMERYQRAEAAQKATAANDVRAVVCGSAEVVATKTTCVTGIDATVKALALKREVEIGLEDIEQKRMTVDDPRAKELPKKLDDAERFFIEGRATMKECDQKLLALRMKHGV
jgi:hypothetical protein